MLQMTTDEITRHILSLRREGRIQSFDRVTDILSKFMSTPRNLHCVFNTSVDPVALKLPTYTSIVKHPMDVGTIKRNIAAGGYLELDDFVSDVRLVFENAMLLNPELRKTAPVSTFRVVNSHVYSALLASWVKQAGKFDAARTLHVRDCHFQVNIWHLEMVVRVFDEISERLAQMRPGTDTISQRIPARTSYLFRGLYVFQKHEGMKICLFTIYAQEYGDDCELEANRRATYVAYLNSVRYLEPATARTPAYH